LANGFEFFDGLPIAVRKNGAKRGISFLTPMQRKKQKLDSVREKHERMTITFKRHQDEFQSMQDRVDSDSSDDENEISR
jgi:hypothetical protein